MATARFFNTPLVTFNLILKSLVAVHRRLRVRLPRDLHRPLRRLLCAHRARLHHLRGHEHGAIRLRLRRDGRGHISRRLHDVRRAQGRIDGLSHSVSLTHFVHTKELFELLVSRLLTT